MVISTIISAFVFPFVGQVCDLFSPRKTIPFAFIFRAMTTGMFYCVNQPNSYLAYISAIMMIVGTIIENISIDTIFAKNLPKETRGILNGVYSFSGQVGILIYSFVSGWLFDTYGPKSPFVLVGFLDVLFAFSVIIASSFFGLFNAHEEIDRQKRSKSSNRRSSGNDPISQGAELM